MAHRSKVLHAAIVALALLCCVALVWWRLSRDPWAAAADHVRAHASARDLVVLTPAHHFTDASSFAGLMVVAADSLSPSDARRFDAVWVVTPTEPPKPLARALAPLGEPERSDVRGLSVLRYTAKPGSGS
jgi:hypothetical protein